MTDRRTDGRTDGQTDRHVAVAKTRASIASHGYPSAGTDLNHARERRFLAGVNARSAVGAALCGQRPLPRQNLVG